MPISIAENIITLVDGANESPRRRRGRKTHVSCLYRWSTHGCRGVVLETIQVGGTRCTSQETLQRFFERLSEALEPLVGDVGPTQPIVGTRASAPRDRRSVVAVLEHGT